MGGLEPQLQCVVGWLSCVSTLFWGQGVCTSAILPRAGCGMEREVPFPHTGVCPKSWNQDHAECEPDSPRVGLLQGGC